MVTVNDILKEKGNIYYWVEPCTITIDVLKLMSEKNIGAVLVMDNDKLVGIFSERDYARKLALFGKSSTDTHVSEFMSREITTVTENTSIQDCMGFMTDKRVRHLPVMKNDKVVGIVSIGDIVSYIIREQKSTIDQLQNYITGR